jgi:hypothetical protein
MAARRPKDRRGTGRVVSLGPVTSRPWALAGVLVVVAASCDGPADEEMSREAQIYLAAVRQVIAEQAPPASGDDELPVVYVVPVGESDIGATVQAEVAGELREQAEVRFADDRSEAVLEDDEGMPVRDEGTLIAIDEVPAEGEPIDVEVEVYRSAADSSKVVFTFAPRSSQWAVTSTSVLGPDES